MSTRKIKNAVNNTTGELIYFKGHAQATYMSDGSTVEDAIKNIKPDLSDYVKSEELEGYAKTSDIPSLEGYAKTEDIPSVEGFVKSEDLPNFDEFAKTEDIPSLDGYVQSSELPNFDEFAKEEDIPSLYGYATQQWVNEQEFAHQNDLLNVSFNDIQDSPITENNDGEVNIVDENGNIALKVNDEGIYVKDVIAGDHILSNKADTSYVDEVIAGIVDGGNNSDIYVWNGWDGVSTEGTMTEEEYNAIKNAKVLVLNIYEVSYCLVDGKIDLGDDGMLFSGKVKNIGDDDYSVINIIIHNDLSFYIDSFFETIPTYTSQLENDSNFVSSDNFKTINGESILGSGDITIQGGGLTLTETDIAAMGFTKNMGTVQSVETSETLDEVNTTTYVKYVAQTLTNAQKAQARANIGAAAVGEGGGSSYVGNYPVETVGSESITMQPNTYYKVNSITAMDAVDIIEFIQGDSSIVNEYVFEVHIDDSPWAIGENASLILPGEVIWANDKTPPMLVNKTYVISIVNNLAVYIEF